MMTSDLTLDLFPFIDTAHPFYASVEHCKDVLLAHSRFQSLLEQDRAQDSLSLRVTMKTTPLDHRPCTLKRICLSFQWYDVSKSSPFQAITFMYSGRKKHLECFEFPQDPCLPEMGTVLDGLSVQPSDPICPIHVLRYVPRRRLTFQARPFGTQYGLVIGKHIRGGVLQDTYEKLNNTFFAVKESRPSFCVAGPQGMNQQLHTFYQEFLDGDVLTSLIEETSFPSLLYSVGGLHQELHRIEVPGIPHWNATGFLHDLPNTIDWITFFLPEKKRFFDTLLKVLLKNPPLASPGDWTFCHGDFSCNQILLEKNRWAVVDFDECVFGDPYFEMAMFLASLSYQLPLFQHSDHSCPSSTPDLLEQATESYLQGYEDSRQQCVDRHRLLWHRLYAEMIYFTRTLRRNLFHPHTFEQHIQFLQMLGEQILQDQGHRQ